MKEVEKKEVKPLVTYGCAKKIECCEADENCEATVYQGYDGKIRISRCSC